MNSVLLFTAVDDERVVVTWNGEFVIETNHDDHGWDGMGAIRKSLTRVAELAGWEVRDA